MKRRDFLKSMAAMVGWFAVGCMPAKESAQEAPKEADRRGYYHILLVSDLHLPVRSKKFPGQAEQADVWQKKQRLLETVNAWGDVDEAALLGKAKLAAFQKRYKQPGLYYARSVGDCRLLYLAPDGFGTYVELSSEQLDWLKSEIAAHKTGPMFFFCHAPLMGTLRTYGKKINTPDFTAQPSEPLAEILADVPPGSLWISGHTHTPPTNDSFADDSVNRVHRNLVNIHNPTIDACHIYTNSLFLYKDRAVVRTYDHNEGKWLESLDRTFPFVGA